MERPICHLIVERHGDVWCTRLAAPRLMEHQLEELGEEFARLIDEEGCRKMVLTLGPHDPECLYSVFLAKLVALQRRLLSEGGGFRLAEVSDVAHDIFAASHLDGLFDFDPTTADAVAALRQS